jgi:hypothetical protein
MSEESPQKELLQEMAKMLARFRPGGDLAPIEDRQEWERLVHSHSHEERELLQELANFSDLWSYFQIRREKLGPEIVASLREAHELPVSQRILRLREINQRLFERIYHDGQRT